MENFLNEEQIAHLKSLDTKENQLSFVLECILENVLGKYEKIDDEKTGKLQNLWVDIPQNELSISSFFELRLTHPMEWLRKIELTWKQEDFDRLKSKTVKELMDMFEIQPNKSDESAKKENLVEKAERIIEETIWKPLSFDMLRDEPLQFQKPREQSQEQFFKDILNISKFYNAQIIEEWINYKPKKTYSQEDLEKAFNASRETTTITDNMLPNIILKYRDFNDYLKTMKNE